MGTPFIGQLLLGSWDFAPKGYLACNGQLLTIAANQPLFSLLGTSFGGNGQTNFQLPNLQGRTPIGFNTNNSPYTVGSAGGADYHTLISEEVPPHSHQVMGISAPAGSKLPAGQLFAITSGNATFYGPATGLAGMNPATVSTVGGQPHENRQPYLVMNWCIALVGIYPSRN